MGEHLGNPKSFRITDETMELFRQVSAEVQGNQQQTMSRLIEAYQLQKGKALLPERADDIEKFEDHLTVLSQMYRASLEGNHQVTETVRAEFAAQLDSKEYTIQNLQEQVKSAEKAAERFQREQEILKEKLQEEDQQLRGLKKELEAREEACRMSLLDKERLLEEREKVNRTLEEAFREKEQELALCQEERRELLEDLETAKSWETLAGDLERTIKEQERRLLDLEQELAAEEQRREEAKEEENRRLEQLAERQQFLWEKKLFAQEKSYQELLQDKDRAYAELQREKQKEIDAYQEQCRRLLLLQPQEEKETSASQGVEITTALAVEPGLESEASKPSEISGASET